MTNSSEKIGFVGVGLMGHGMAKNILAKGFPLAVIGHRNRSPVEDLVKNGAIEAKTPAELAQQTSVIFTCLPGSPQVESAVEQLSVGLQSGTVIVDCSTADPTSTMAIAEKLSEKGVELADAPLGGTPTQAHAGELAAMVGAKDEVYKRIEPIIKTWAKSVVHLGSVGDGHRMKLLNNFLSMGYAALYSEALALAEKVGISIDKFDSVLQGSRMDCGFYQTYMDHVKNGNLESHKFTLTNALKDMKYLESMADSVNLINPMGNAIKNSFAVAIAAGGTGPEDYVPSLAKIIRQLNGMGIN